MPTSKKAWWRMNRRLVLPSVCAVAVAGTVFGGVTIVPYVSSHSASTTQVSSIPTIDVGAGNTDLWSTSSAHQISLQISQDNLDQLLSSYQEEGEKDWVKATLTIDGVTIEDVGVRLKGNSTLRTLANNNGAGAAPGGGGAPAGDAAGGDAAAGGGGGGMGGGGPMATGITAADPSTWPLLISFDKYYEGRVYQGRTEISIRPGTPVLNEATSLSLTAQTGQPTQSYSYATYSINGGTATTRLVLEIPDENYANSLGNGILYKADAESSFSYQGDDQTTYTDQFVQINGSGDGDVQPIINLLKWIDSASDEEFAAHLADYVDVQSFARYLATQNLLANSDDMAGPGQNYYLWYDRDTGKISVVSWDLNMTMNSQTSAAPTDSISMGGGGGGMDRGPQAQQQNATTGQSTTDGATAAGATATTSTAAAQPPATGGTASAGDTAATGNTAATGAATATTGQQTMGGGPAGGGAPGGEAPGGGGGMRAGNTLKTKFLAATAFRDLYLQEYWALYDQIYGNDNALTTLANIVSTVPVSAGLSAETLNSSAETLKTWLSQRASALAEMREQYQPATS